MAKKRRTTRSPAAEQAVTPTPSVRFKPKNSIQVQAWELLQDKEMIILEGPAGVGKTHLAVAFGIQSLISGQTSKLIITRPIVEAGEKLGFLPGTFEDKTAPYMRPIFDCLELMVSRGPARAELLKQIEVAPLAYLRGRTLTDAICILDEAQNATYVQLKMFLTRLGENSKMIVTGDPNQSDLPGGLSGLALVADRVKGVEGLGYIKFDGSHVVRPKIVADILTCLP